MHSTHFRHNTLLFLVLATSAMIITTKAVAIIVRRARTVL